MITKLHDLFQPNNYQLALNIDSEKLEFSGRVSITGLITKNSNILQVHAKGLEVQAATINGVVVKVSDGEFDTLTLEAESELARGKIEVAIDFRGKITEGMHGMYPCYFEHEGKRKNLIATQFESHHAREAFPCIDEPAAKATVSLTE